MKKGEEYFNRRDNLRGKILSYDDFTVTMELENNTSKIYTRSMFKKWWVSIESKPMNEIKQGIKDTNLISKIETEFVRLLNQYGDEKLEKFYRKNHCIVKYNGRIIIETIKTKFKYTVFAHIDALTPQLSGKYEILPEEYHKNLRAKFVLTSLTEAQQLLKIIVTDSIFYRK